MMTVPDQGIGFDQEGLPYELNNLPPHICNCSETPLRGDRSDPYMKGGRCSSGFDMKQESSPAPLSGGGNGGPPSDDNDSDKDGSGSDESDNDMSHGDGTHSSDSDSNSIQGTYPSNVQSNT